MITTDTVEIFSRDFYISLKQTWLAYIKREVHVNPEYFLFYTLVKGKNPFKVFSPLSNPKKIETVAREHNAGPWNALQKSLWVLKSCLGSSTPVTAFTLYGARTNGQYDPVTRKFTYDQVNYDIALNSEQIEYLLEKVNATLEQLK